jgi:hypothetical protein
VLTPLTLDSVSRSQKLTRPSRRRRANTAVFLGGVAAFAVIGGLLAFLWLRPRPQPVAGPPPPVDAAPLVAVAQADAGFAPMVIEASDAAPGAHPVKHPAKVVKHPKVVVTKVPPPAKVVPPVVEKPRASTERVEAKFRAVRTEYADFKKAYGNRLESEWSAVLFLATYGKADKYEKLDGMIDRLRSQMSRVRAGTE